MADDFTRESTATQWVNSSSLCINWNTCIVIGLITEFPLFVLPWSHFAIHNNDKSYLPTVFDTTVIKLYADFGFGATKLFWIIILQL
jgi:hypothetical protein